jgi:uncharacterized protein (DUF1499 family)
MMQLPDLKSLSFASTVRTYPVTAQDLARATQEAVRNLPGWKVKHATDTEIRAVRRTRLFGFVEDITVRLAQGQSGASTNTRISFISASRAGLWDFGQNRRNLDELLAAMDQQLTTEG